MTNAYDMNHLTYQDTGLGNQIIQQFIASQISDVVVKRISFALSNKNISLYGAFGVFAKIKSLFKESRVVMPDVVTVHFSGKVSGKVIGCATDGSEDIILVGSIQNASGMFVISLDVVGHPELVTKLIQSIGALFKEESLPSIKWWFRGRHGSDDKDLYLPPNKDKIKPEFYPSLQNPHQFLDDYMDSSESVLLLAGPPGTGKTSLLRELIYRHKLCAHVIYDELLMEQDGPFQGFLFNDWENSDVMILEDADTILSSRERDGNKLMSRFLNISDGLIKLPNKKLIFSTNITDFGNIDSALIRPGRCFGIIHTRALTYTEACKAAEVAGLVPPKIEKEYTLAELFANGKTQTVRKMGFV